MPPARNWDTLTSVLKAMKKAFADTKHTATGTYSQRQEQRWKAAYDVAIQAGQQCYRHWPNEENNCGNCGGKVLPEVE